MVCGTQGKENRRNTMTKCYVCEQLFKPHDYVVPVTMGWKNDIIVTNTMVMIHVICGLKTYLQEAQFDKMGDITKAEITEFLMDTIMKLGKEGTKQ